MSKIKHRKWCETCQYWKIGDPADRVANVGLCTWTDPRLAVVKKANRQHTFPASDHVPFWMQSFYRSTTSWEGNNCCCWQLANAKKLKQNKC